MKRLGIDIGGTGIKGAIVDTETGELVEERYRLLTPQPSKPEAVAATVAEICAKFDWKGPIGCGFPAVVQGGVVKTAANVDEEWIGTDGQALISKVTGCPTWMLNDADAAGLAEMRFGAGKGHLGTVIILTIGTGIGSAIFTRGVLVTNTEFGHLRLKGRDAEKWISDAVREQEELTWKRWGRRFNRYLRELDTLFSPEIYLLGGGGSKHYEKFIQYLETSTPVLPATLLNDAGIVGAALAVEGLEE